MNYVDEDEDILEDEYDYDEDEGNESIKINLPQPHKGQQLVLQSTSRFKVLLCGRRWGKTLIAQIIAIRAMLDGKKVAYIVPEFSLARDFHKKILQYLPDKVIRQNNRSDLYVELITGGELKFFSGEALDNLRGRAFHYGILDEAAYLNLGEYWYSAIRPTLSDYRGEAIFISTPRGMNTFYSFYLKGRSKEEGFESWHFPTNSNPYFPQGEFEEAKATYPTAKFNEEYLALPMENQANPFGTDAIIRNTITELSKGPSIIYGIDLASHSDFTVIIGLDANGSMTYYGRFQLPWSTTMDRIRLLGDDVMKVIDSTGVGDVVFDELSQSMNNIRGFKFTSSSKPAIINQLINAIQKDEVKFNEATASELMVFEFHRTSTGHIKYEAQRGFHDDAVCALAIANHYKYQAFSNSQWQLYTV